jgi:hypothetical protein
VDPTGAVLGIVWLFTGVVLSALAIPLITGRVAMNHWYGVRVKRSFESNELWYKINRHGGIRLLAGGGIISFLGSVALFLDLGNNPALLVLFALIPLAVVIAAAADCVWYARRA